MIPVFALIVFVIIIAIAVSKVRQPSAVNQPQNTSVTISEPSDNAEDVTSATNITESALNQLGYSMSNSVKVSVK